VRPRFVVSGLLASLAAALAVLTLVPALAQGPVRIGASLSMTGTYAQPGNFQREGYLLCEKDVKAVDADGFQIAHKMVTLQWQDAKRVVVWPESVAGAKARIPTPPWSRR
jgi:hypothetical protein